MNKQAKAIFHNVRPSVFGLLLVLLFQDLINEWIVPSIRSFVSIWLIPMHFYNLLSTFPITFSELRRIVEFFNPVLFCLIFICCFLCLFVSRQMESNVCSSVYGEYSLHQSLRTWFSIWVKGDTKNLSCVFLLPIFSYFFYFLLFPFCLFAIFVELFKWMRVSSGFCPNFVSISSTC